MTTSLKDLIAQREALDAQIAETQNAERADAVQRVKSLMAEFGLSVADLSSRVPKTAKVEPKPKVAAKYIDKDTKATWSGRGLKPKWLSAKIEAGQTLDDFKI